MERAKIVGERKLQEAEEALLEKDSKIERLDKELQQERLAR